MNTRLQNSLTDYRERFRGLSPNARSILLFSVGLLLGLVVLGWVIMPVRWTRTYPVDLRTEYRSAYIEAVADSFAVNGDVQLAADRLSSWDSNQILALLYRHAQVLDNDGRNDDAERVRTLADNLESADVLQASDTTPALSGENLRLIIYIGLGILILAVLFVVLKSILDSRRQRQGQATTGGESWPQFDDFVTSADALAAEKAATMPRTSAPAPPAEAEGLDMRTQPASAAPVRRAPEPVKQPASVDAGSEAIRAAGEAALRGAAVSTPAAGAVMAGVTTANRVKYVTGADDNFNVAYRIEERDELLGEYGVGIGVASSVNPDEALTMDVWLFDKSDINSVSGVLMHPDVLRDDARRDAFVSGNNVAIALKPGEEFQLRTRTLEVVGKVTAVSFGTAERTGIPIRSMEIEILGRPIHI